MGSNNKPVIHRHIKQTLLINYVIPVGDVIEFKFLHVTVADEFVESTVILLSVISDCTIKCFNY